MAILDNLKTLADLAGQARNIELHNNVLELQKDVSKLLAENAALKEKNQDLMEKLKFKESIEVINYTYWLKDKKIPMHERGPFCTSCWDKKQIAMRLVPVNSNEDNFKCPNQECSNELLVFPENKKSVNVFKPHIYNSNR